jgi:hypothetical protein
VPALRSESRSAALLDQAESIRDRFDEACEHALRESAPDAGFALGPLVTLKMEELTPGTLGWRRDVRPPGETSPDAEARGSLGLTVAPAGAAAQDSPEWLAGSSKAARGTERSVRVVSDGPPRVLIWSEARQRSDRERLEAMLDRVEDVYRSESDRD